MAKTFQQQSVELLAEWATLEKETSLRKGFAQATIANNLQFQSHKSIRRQIGYTIGTVDSSIGIIAKELIGKLKK